MTRESKVSPAESVICPQKHPLRANGVHGTAPSLAKLQSS